MSTSGFSPQPIPHRGITLQPGTLRVILALTLILHLTGTGHGQAAAETVDSFVHDFGVVPAGGEVRHAFTVTNNGTVPMDLTEWTSSCPRAHILSHPRRIPAGASGEVEIRWLPRETGPAVHTLSLQTAHAAQTALRFQLKGTVQPDHSTGQEAPVGSDPPGAWLTRTLGKPDPALLRSVEALKTGSPASQRTLFVDTRSLPDYEQCRIPGSLHAPLHSLKTKEFLKTAPLILVGKGPHYGGMEPECDLLRSRGFTVSILEGGIRAWKGGGQILEGDGCTDERLNILSPVELFEARHDENWLLINAARSQQAEGRRLLPHAHPLPRTENREELLQQLKSLGGPQPGGGPLTVVLFDDDGSTIASLAKMLSKSEFAQTLYLEGGIESYRGFLERQPALFSPPGSPTRKAQVPCTTCP